MDISPITDFFTNIKEKITNPFFGTLIIVSIVRNWDLVYSIFNFSDKTSRIYKVQYIRNYLAEKNIFFEAGLNIAWAISIVLVGYFFVVVFRTLSIWIEFNLMVDLTEKAKNDKIVFKEDYDKLKEDRDKYAERYEDQRIRVRNYSKDNDDLTEKEQKQSKMISDFLERINILESDANQYASNLNQKNNEIEQITIDKSNLENTIKDNEIEIDRVYDEILLKKQEFQDMQTDLTNELQQKNLKIEDLNKAVLESEQVYRDVVEHYKSKLSAIEEKNKKLQSDNDQLSENLKFLHRQNDNREEELQVLKFLNIRYRDSVSRLFRFNNRIQILEYFENNDVFYFNTRSRILITPAEFMDLMNNSEEVITESQHELNSAIDIFKRFRN